MTTAVQPMRALALGNERRVGAAQLKRNLRSLPAPEAKREASRILVDLPEGSASIRIEALLKCVRGLGPRSIKRLLDDACVPDPHSFLALDRRSERRLSERQRLVLANLLTPGSTERGFDFTGFASLNPNLRRPVGRK
jgi:hypothetical protein